MMLWRENGSRGRFHWLMAALVFSFLAVILLSSAMARPPVESDPAKDAALAAELKAKLAEDPELRYAEIDISVRNQVAYLFGIFVRDVDPREFVELALDVPGIVSVVNYMNNTSVLPLDSDRHIKRNTQHHLTFTPFGNTSGVVLTVQDGIAYLDGSVESWRGLASAEDAAYAGGATTIVNRLKILHPALPYSYRRNEVQGPPVQGR